MNHIAQNSVKFCSVLTEFAESVQKFCAVFRVFFLRDLKRFCAVLFCKTAQDSTFCALSQNNAHPWLQALEIYSFNGLQQKTRKIQNRRRTNQTITTETKTALSIVVYMENGTTFLVSKKRDLPADSTLVQR